MSKISVIIVWGNKINRISPKITHVKIENAEKDLKNCKQNWNVRKLAWKFFQTLKECVGVLTKNWNAKKNDQKIS